MSDENIKPEDRIVEPIVREIGDRVIIDGRDYVQPSVRVISNTFRDAQDHEKAIYISQVKGQGVSLSLSTLRAIVDWATAND
jgi:hypothetical protein